MHNILRIIIFVCFIVLLDMNYSFSQVTRSFDIKYHYGYTIPMYEAFNYILNSESQGFEINAIKHSSKSNIWDILYNYPGTGIGYSFWSLGNNEILGYANTFHKFIDFNLFSKIEKFKINYRIYFGFAYLTKCFHPYENPLNRAIGSHENIFFRLSLNSNYKVNKNFNLLTEFGFSHFSNGKIKTPNYGINIITLSAGLKFLHQNSFNYVMDSSVLTSLNTLKKFKHNFILSSGFKVYENLLGRKYNFLNITYHLQFMKNIKNQWGAGVDFFYDESIGEALAKNGINDSCFYNKIRIGIHLGHSFQYKNTAFQVMLGHYLYTKYTDLTKYYVRLLLKYYLSNKINIGIGIKAHRAKADMLEWSIGYSF